MKKTQHYRRVSEECDKRQYEKSSENKIKILLQIRKDNTGINTKYIVLRKLMIFYLSKKGRLEY